MRAGAILPALAALVVFLVLIGLYYLGRPDLYDLMLRGWGILPFRSPFLDTAGGLAAWDCTRLGFDVIEADPCDPMNRSYNYSPFWMDLAFVPLRGADRTAVGIATGVLFVLGLALLPAVRGAGDMALMCLACVSTMPLFAMDRGNPDIFLLLLGMGVVGLIRRGTVARLVAYAVVWFMIAVKYYPAAFFVLALRERLRVLLALALASVVFGVLFVGHYYTNMMRAMAELPQGSYDSVFFGARNVPFYLARGVMEATGDAASAAILTVLVQVALILFIWRRARRWMGDGPFRTGLARLDEWAWLLLVSNAAILVFCFFAGHNIGYRGIFLLPVLPAFLLLARLAPERALLWRASAWLVVFILWGEAIRNAIGRLGLAGPVEFAARNLFWTAREAAWWWVMALLVTVLLDFIARSRAWRELTGQGRVPNA